MTAMRHLALSLMLASSVGAQSAAPRVIERDPIIGVRARGEPLSEAALRAACPPVVLADPGPQDVGHDGAPFRSWCGVDTSYVLPEGDGARWMAVTYSRFGEYAADQARRNRRGQMRDTVRLISSVLYSRRDPLPEWSPEWIGTVDALYVRSIDIEVAPRPDRSLLAGVRYCFNGTGGCWQHFLRRVSSRWTAVVEQYDKSFPRIPDGRIGKGAGVDVRSLAGSFGVYADRDPNCCPSRELAFQLEQRGDSLLLKSHEIRRP